VYWRNTLTLSTDRAEPPFTLLLAPLAPSSSGSRSGSRRSSSSCRTARSSFCAAVVTTFCSSRRLVRFFPSSDFTAGTKLDHPHGALSTDDQVSARQQDDISRVGQADDALVGSRCHRVFASRVIVADTRSCGDGSIIVRGRSQTVDLLEQKGVMTDLQEREDISKVNVNHVGTGCK
jgi:hypothetical protein